MRPEAEIVRAKKFLTAGAGALILGLVIFVSPKDRSFASTSRFALAATFLTASGVGIALSAAGLRLRGHTRRSLRFASASSAIKDTLGHLREEEDLSRRRRAPIACGAHAALALSLLAQWPQLSALANLRNGLITTSTVCCGLLALNTWLRGPPDVGASRLYRWHLILMVVDIELLCGAGPSVQIY